MARVAAKNTRSQDEIKRSLGLSSVGSQGSQSTPSARRASVTPTSGSGAAPAGWYGSGTSTFDALRSVAADAKTAAGSKVKQTVDDIKGVTGGSESSSGFQRRTAPAYESFDYDEWDMPTFRTSELTDNYLKKMQDTENAAPGPYESKYEGAIQSILDGILSMGGKSFDASKDANYNLLYNQMREQYMNAGRKAMQDTMGSMQAATGGYGSTAAAAAGSQAYDNYLQQMNAQNPQLMELAFQMQQAQNQDRYNQLSAVEGVEDREYGKYRDEKGDWQKDRDYFADQYQRAYGNDWDKYAFDTQMDFDNYRFQTDIDFQNHQNAQNRAWDDYTFGTQMDWNQYADQLDREHQAERDKVSDYDSAFDRAYKMAAAGMTVPGSYGSMLEADTLSSLNALAAQIQAQQAAALAGGSGGGGGGGRRSSGKKSSDKETVVYSGQPFASGIGYTANRNTVAQAVNSQKGDQAKYNTIEDAVAAGLITQEQGLELIQSAGLNMGAVKQEDIMNPGYSPIRQAMRLRR